MRSISKHFAGLRALNEVNLTLQRGEILGLIGPNGSGKTTLINVVTGLLPATSGQMFVDGRRNHQPKIRIKLRMRGWHARSRPSACFRDLTVLENVEVAAVSFGLSRACAYKSGHTRRWKRSA